MNHNFIRLTFLLTIVAIPMAIINISEGNTIWGIKSIPWILLGLMIPGFIISAIEVTKKDFVPTIKTILKLINE